VTSLDIEPDDDDDDDDDGGSCSYDRLQLFDGVDVHHSDPLSARLCGHVAPSTTFLTSANAAAVHFRSDYFTTASGFRLEYHVVVPRRGLVATQRRTGIRRRVSTLARL